jgi:hypothetical protein
MVRDSRTLIGAVHTTAAVLLVSAAFVGVKVGGFIDLTLPRADQERVADDESEPAADSGSDASGTAGEVTGETTGSEPQGDLTGQAATVQLQPADGVISADGAFAAGFDGAPSTPTPWAPSNWDVTVHSRNTGRPDTLDPMDALHGPDCAPPPDTHVNETYEGAVYICRDHLMTAIKDDGYGAIYLTPDAMVDLSAGTASISFDVSTLTLTNRDWWDVWISPYDEQLQTPLEEWLPDLSGGPRNGVHVRLHDAGSIGASTYTDFAETQLPTSTTDAYDTFLTPDSKRRDTFVIELSTTHLKVGMPQYDVWWIDADIAELPFTAGVVQFGHHSYNPLKDCEDKAGRGPGGTCAPNTWHWDNVSISPAVPFAIARATSRVADADRPRVSLSSPSPDDAHLRFSGIGGNLEFSTDGGATWQPAQRQAVGKETAPEHFASYWTPVPAGTTSIVFRGQPDIAGDWIIRDVTVWSPGR